MLVRITPHELDMEIKNKGITIAVADTRNKHVGNLIITKTKLIWCDGKVRQQNGIPVTWEKFPGLMRGSVKAKPKAKRKVKFKAKGR